MARPKAKILLCISIAVILCTTLRQVLMKDKQSDNRNFVINVNGLNTKIDESPVVYKDNTKHIAMIASRPEFVEEILVSIKSVLLFTNSSVHFHIYCYDSIIQEAIEVNKWKILSCASSVFQYSIHIMNPSFATEYVIDKSAFAHLPYFFKLNAYFMFKELKGVNSILYADSDVLFMADVQKWFDIQKQFDDQQLSAMGPCGYRYFSKYKDLHPWPKPIGLNSGIILANLTRWRHYNIWNEFGDIFDEYTDDIIREDQGLLNIYFGKHPERIHQFPCGYAFHIGLDACIVKLHEIPEEYEVNRKRVCSDLYSQGILALHGSNDAFEQEFKKIKRHQYYGPALIFRSIMNFDLHDPDATSYWSSVFEKYIEERKLNEKLRPGCDDPGKANDLLITLGESVIKHAPRWKHLCVIKN